MTKTLDAANCLQNSRFSKRNRKLLPGWFQAVKVLPGVKTLPLLSSGTSKPATQGRHKSIQGIAVKKCGDWLGLGSLRYRHSQGPPLAGLRFVRSGASA